jgi:uncharacterized membrane protein
MPSQINGLPTHPLVIHAAVVLVPLAALLGVLFAIPRTRAWSRVPLVLVSLAAAGAVFAAKLTGQQLLTVITREGQMQGPVGDAVRLHQQRANVLVLAMLGYAVLAIAAFVVSRRTTGTELVTTIAAVLLVAGAAGVAFQTYRVGDVGSRAVWNPTGQRDFSTSGNG